MSNKDWYAPQELAGVLKTNQIVIPFRPENIVNLLKKRGVEIHQSENGAWAYFDHIPTTHEIEFINDLLTRSDV